MKKQLIYSLTALASIALAGCNGDYDDWAMPQSNSPEEAAAAYNITVSTPFPTNIDDVISSGKDSVSLLTVSTDNKNVSELVLKSVKINDHDVKASIIANEVAVSINDIDSIIRLVYNSRQHVERDLDVKTDISALLTNGDAVYIGCFKTTSTITPISTPQIDPNGYYLLGDFVGGGFDLGLPIKMTMKSEGVYQATVETKSDGDNWFKFYEQSHYSATSWDEVNLGQMGCAKNGDNTTDGFIVWNGDSNTPGGVQTAVISGKGHYIITIDMINMKYSITAATAYLYVAGDWNNWKQTDVIASPKFDGNYTGFMYMTNGGFKLCSQANWDGTNYGLDFSTDGNAKNMVFDQADGYYKMDVNMTAKTVTFTAITSLGLVGSATPNEWDQTQPTEMTYNIADRCWEISNVTLIDGEMKFVANKAWDINWGGTADKLKQGGDNLKVTAGTYDIKLFAWCDGMAYCTMTKK